ncbi:PAS domain S-box protein [Ponticaulis sp.]|uniref:PAS domain S-box protein n=1 Tax=Ponticaulis sp. TaxID=2020902 RepID=UPI0025E6FD95|nr:PAS domain S-box protein [Ponticaulis sp.]
MSNSELQDKGEEPYMQLARTLAPGQVAFSEIDLNRENGVVDPTRTPTIRAITPVSTRNSAVPGAAVVINADYGAILQDMVSSMNIEVDTLIFNEEGDSLRYDPATGMSELLLAEEAPEYLKNFIADFADAPNEQIFQRDGVFYHASTDQTLVNNPGRSFTVLQTVPNELIYSEFASNFAENFAFAGLLMAIFLACATIAASRLTAPLRSVTSTLRTFPTGHDVDELNLPYDRNDEIGDMSVAFRDLMNELARERMQKQKFFQHAVDAFAMIDRNGIIQSVNPACEELFGYSEEELLGQNVKMLMPMPYSGEHDQYLANYQRTGKAKIIGIGRDVEATHKDGSTFPISLSISQFYQNGQVYYCGSMRDISNRKQMERMKDEFVSTVNHELRTPLTSIFGSLDLLRRMSEGKLDERCERLITLAHEGCSRLTNLVNDILDLEKIAAGKMEYHLQTLSAQELVEDVVRRHETLADRFGVRFLVQHFCEDQTVTVDANRFNQASVNLLSNAAKFSPDGGVVSIWTEANADKFIRICVRDEGPGIPDNFKTRIFEKFAQADGSNQRKTQGTGLGLNITKTIIEAFGGKIAFETEIDKGTTFYFDLPESAELDQPLQVAS